MKVLFCIDSLKPGGAEKIMVNTVNELVKDTSLDITVISLKKDEGYSVDKNIRVKFFMKNGRFYRKIIKFFPAWLLHRMIVKDKYDVEIAFIEGASTKVISGCPYKQVRKYAWVHTDMIKYPWSQRSYRSVAEEKKAYQKFDKVLSVSTGTAGTFSKKIGIPAIFVRNCINEAEILENADMVKESLYDHSYFNIVSVGSLKKIKGYERLIPVHSYLKEKGIKCRHYILGDGQLKEELKQKIEEAELQDTIIMKGYDENPYPWIKQADLLVCVSYAEGYSSVVSEAVILKTPVLTTDCSGMIDILGDSEYGMIVKNDDKCIAEGLEKMISDQKLYQHYRLMTEYRSDEFCLKKQIKNLRTKLEI